MRTSNIECHFFCLRITHSIEHEQSHVRLKLICLGIGYMNGYDQHMADSVQQQSTWVEAYSDVIR